MEKVLIDLIIDQYIVPYPCFVSLKKFVRNLCDQHHNGLSFSLQIVNSFVKLHDFLTKLGFYFQERQWHKYVCGAC